MIRAARITLHYITLLIPTVVVCDLVLTFDFHTQLCQSLPTLCHIIIIIIIIIITSDLLLYDVVNMWLSYHFCCSYRRRRNSDYNSVNIG